MSENHGPTPYGPCRDLGLLLGKGGLHGQNIRFSPPMCINQQDADFILEVLHQSLGSL